jgi:hypothetical protein
MVKYIIILLFFPIVVSCQNWQTSNVTTRDVGCDGCEVVWDDLRFPATQTKLNPVTDKPDFDFDEIGLLFPDADTTEKIYIIAQFPHGKKFLSDIEVHIHYMQETSDSAVFGMQYRWYNLNEVPPAWTTVFTENNVFDWSSGDTHNMAEFGTITGIDTGVSSIIDMIIWRRTTDGITGDVLVKEVDIHYQIDMIGSLNEGSK